MSRFKIANIIAYGFVTLFSIYVLMPILVMVLTTFKSKREIFLEPLGIPSQFGISSFEKALSVGLGSFMLNSFIVSFFCCLFNCYNFRNGSIRAIKNRF